MIQRKSLQFLLILLSCLLCLGLVSCGTTEPPTDTDDEAPSTTEEPKEEDPKPEAEPEAEPEIVTATYPLADVKDKLKIHGRSSTVGTGISCDFTASGIEFSAYMEGDVKLHLSCTEPAYFSVYVDGVRSSERYLVNPTDSVITLANFEEGGEHTIRVLKQTEAQYALSVLNALEMTGYWLNPPAEKRAYIEFIGDSISCGYGNLGTSAISNAVMGEPQYSDGTQAFAFMTAEKLDVDYSIVGCAGIGIATTGYVPFVESEFYVQQSYFRSTSQAYTPERTPDLVVINLGTNDQNYNVPPAQFKEKVKELITLVRDTHGEDIFIVWCYNMMSEGMFAEAQSAIEELPNHTNVYMCELSRNRNGGAGHPDVEGHNTAAEELVELIQSERLLKTV